MPYQFKISDAGTYRLAIRSYKDHQQFDNYSNDCYTKIAGYDGYQGQDTKTYMRGPTHMWRWDTKHEKADKTRLLPDYEFAAGVYTLEVAGRSKNFHIDRMVFYKLGQVVRTDATSLDRFESPRVQSSVPTTSSGQVPPYFYATPPVGDGPFGFTWDTAKRTMTRHYSADWINDHRKICMYGLKWFSGCWSTIYYPGLNDVTQHDKNDPVWNPQSKAYGRRAWSMFQDHHHWVCYCNYGAFFTEEVVVDNVNHYHPSP